MEVLYEGYMERINLAMSFMYNNPETLKYTLGQKVQWQIPSSEVQEEGTVINVDFYGVDVSNGTEEYWVPFDNLIQSA